MPALYDPWPLLWNIHLKDFLDSEVLHSKNKVRLCIEYFYPEFTHRNFPIFTRSVAFWS